jgi:hypothetical protein
MLYQYSSSDCRADVMRGNLTELNVNKSENSDSIDMPRKISIFSNDFIQL